MPTKDKDKAKEQARLRMQRYRGKGVTSGVTNRIESLYAGERTGMTDVPESTRKPLKPPGLPDMSNLPPERIEMIEDIITRRREMGLEDDSVDRISRALQYREYELSSDYRK